MTCRRDTSMIRIIISKDYDLINVTANLKMNKWINLLTIIYLLKKH